MRKTLGKWFLMTGIVLLLVGGAALWALMRLGNDTGAADFGHEAHLDTSQVAGIDEAARARALVDSWLEWFTTEAGGAARLREYRIQRVEVAEGRGDKMDVTATYAVRPTRRSLDNWVAGSGGTVRDGWVEGKFSRFEMVEGADGVHLRPVGPAPG